MAGPEVKEVKIDEETLKNQEGPISEEQNALIAEAAAKELALENETPEAKKKREDKEAETTKAEQEEAEALATRAKEAGLEEGASEDDVVAAELKGRAIKVGLKEDANLEDVEKGELAIRAKDLGLAEDATLEEIEAKEAEKGEPSEKEKQEKAEREETERLAALEDAELIKVLMTPDKDGKALTEAEAKEVLEKDKAVVKKFDGEPYKLARGYRDIQSRATKAEEALKHTQGLMEQHQIEAAANAKITIPVVKGLIANGKITDGKGGFLTEGQVIAATKEAHPSQTKDKEDEEIIEFAAEKIRDSYLKGQDVIKADRKTKASTKRDELLAKLPEDAKDFETEIKGEVAKFSDAQILSPSFDLTDVIRWAKGNKYDVLKVDQEKFGQERYDAGLKKGQEEAKALGERQPGPKIKGKGKQHASSLTRELNQREQTRALDMYDGLKDLNETEKFKMYIEQFPNENDEFK